MHPKDAIKEALIITDYGIARIQSEGEKRYTGTGEFLGTPQYLAPEYLQGHEVSAAVDVYQMGLILIEALSGRAAVDHQEPFPCIAAHINGTLKIPSALQRGALGEIIRKATALNPEERFADGYQMRDAMAELMSSPLGSHLPTSQRALSHQNAQQDKPPQQVRVGATPTAREAPTFNATKEGLPRQEIIRQARTPTNKNSWLWFVGAAIILGVGLAGCLGVVILGSVMLPDAWDPGDTDATTPLETITINAVRYRSGERQENTEISHSEVTWSPAIPAGELFSVQQTVEQELSREFKALKVRDGVVVRALIRYDKKVSTVTNGAEIINTPSQLEGKRYRVERKGDNLSVKTAAGEAVASAEAYEVKQDSGGFGEPDPLSQLLANRTITMGETIELSRQRAAEVFRSQEGALKVNYFRMTLKRVQIRDGDRVAVFETETEFRRKNLEGQWDLLMTMRGESHFGLETGRMVKLLLSGPLTGTGVVDGVKMTGEGSSTYEVSVRFRDRKK